MSSYSLTEALKHSCCRRQLKSSPPVVSVHKSHSEPAGVMAVEQPMLPQQAQRRRNNEIISVPVRPWHSPRVRTNGHYSSSPPRFSLEPRCARQTRLTKYTSLIQQNQFTNNAMLSGLGSADDSKSMDTEMCVSDTISQDPSVSDNYLCERSARISYSKNCSNSTRNAKRERGHRSSRRQRGEGGRHYQSQSRKERNQCNQLPGSGSKSRQDWSAIETNGRCGMAHNILDNSNRVNYLMSTHLSGLFANANCMADVRSASQSSECTEPEFGCEDLKVCGRWQNSLSNDESATEATMTEDRTCSFELGTDLSALTLSRTELSSTAAAHQIVEPRRNPEACGGAGSPADANSEGQLMEAMRYLIMQANNLPSLLVSQTHYQQNLDYHQQQLVLQHQQQLQQEQLQQQFQQQQQEQLQQQFQQQQQEQLQQQFQQQQEQLQQQCQKQQQEQLQLQFQQQQQHYQEQQQFQQQHQFQQQQQLHQQQQYQSGMPGTGSPPLAATNRHSGLGSSQLAATNRQSDQGSPPLAATNRQGPSKTGGGRNPISHNSSNCSFSLKQSEFSSLEYTTCREEVIPASDDLVHLSVVSCLEAASGSEAVATTAPGVDTEGDNDDEASSTLRADSDRLAVPIQAPEEQQPRRGSLRPCVSQKQQHQLQQQQLAASTAEAADAAAATEASNAASSVQVGDSSADRRGAIARRPSRYGRLKTPEYCKRSSFLSALRHSISHSHISHRAKIKTAAPASHRTKAVN